MEIERQKLEYFKEELSSVKKRQSNYISEKGRRGYDMFLIYISLEKVIGEIEKIMQQGEESEASL